MLQNSNKNAADCYRRAEESRQRAVHATDSSVRRDFLEMEQRWLSLAQSYEFAERLARTTGELSRRRKADTK